VNTLAIADCRLPIDGLPIAGLAIDGLSIGRLAIRASGRASGATNRAIGNPSIANRAIGNPSIANRQPPIGNEVCPS
jgi:hypothetical protein